MVHGVEELILVDERADQEIEESEEEYKPGCWKDGIDNTDYEDQQ